jgi:hypothetical protein
MLGNDSTISPAPSASNDASTTTVDPTISTSSSETSQPTALQTTMASSAPSIVPELESNATAPPAAAQPLTLNSTTTTTTGNDNNPGFGLGIGIGIGAVVVALAAAFFVVRQRARADKPDAPSKTSPTDDSAISTTTGMATEAQHSLDAVSGASATAQKTSRSKGLEPPGHQPKSLDPLTLDYKDQHRSTVPIVEAMLYSSHVDEDMLYTGRVDNEDDNDDDGDDEEDDDDGNRMDTVSPNGDEAAVDASDGSAPSADLSLQ